MMQILYLTAVLLVAVSGVCFWISFGTGSERTKDLAGHLNTAGLILIVLHLILERVGT